MLMRLLLFFSALALLLLASLEFFFFPWVRALAFCIMSCSPCWSRGSLLLPGWFRGNVLCRMGRRWCDWSLWCSFEGFACAHLCPITAISSPLLRIAGRFISQSLTLLLVGRAGWMHLQRRQNHLPAPPARTAPLRSSPSSALPEDSSHGSHERRMFLQDFSLPYVYIMITIDHYQGGTAGVAPPGSAA